MLEVTERLSAFDGIGRKKAVMAVEILDTALWRRARGSRVRAGRLRRAGEAGVPAQRARARRTPARRSRPRRWRRAPRRRARSTCPRGLSAGRPAGPRCRCATNAGSGRVCPRLVELSGRGCGRASVGRAQDEAGEQLGEEVGALLRHRLAGHRDLTQLVHPRGAQDEHDVVIARWPREPRLRP